MAKTISLDEALNIFKGNLSLLSSDQIKEAKKVINEQGTPADKFFLEALTRGDLGRRENCLRQFAPNIERNKQF